MINEKAESASPAVLAQALRVAHTYWRLAPVLQQTLQEAADRLACPAGTCGECVTCLQREKNKQPADPWWWPKCDHRWDTPGIVIDTYPETYHRFCTKCERVETQSGEDPWCFDWMDTFARLQNLRTQAEAVAADLRARLDSLTGMEIDEELWVRWADVQAALAP